MGRGLISRLANEVDHLHFASLNDETDDEANVDFSAVPAADAEPFLARDPEIDEHPNAVGYDSDATASDVAWSESDEIDANLTSDAAGMSEGNEEPMMPDVEEEVDDAEFLEGWE